jgi:hypothetical protein
MLLLAAKGINVRLGINPFPDFSPNAAGVLLSETGLRLLCWCRGKHKDDVDRSGRKVTCDIESQATRSVNFGLLMDGFH